MRAITGTLLLLLVGAGALSSSPLPQNARSRSVEVLVQRQDRSFVTTVGSADLQIAVGGAPVAIDRVDRVDGPVSVMLLVDLSLSAATRKPNEFDPADPRAMVQAIDRDFAKKLPPTDRARVGWFAGSTLLASETFTSDRAALAAAVTDLLVRRRPSDRDVFGPSPMVDAVAGVVDVLAKEPGRRAILLISDGESSANRLSVEEGARRAVANGVAVHTMLEAPTQREGTVNAIRYPPRYDRGRLLSKLAGLTGGAFRRDDRFTDFSWGFTMPMPPFEYFFTAMHSSLRVTFSGADLRDGAEIDVTSRDPKLLVSAPRWLPAEP